MEVHENLPSRDYLKGLVETLKKAHFAILTISIILVTVKLSYQGSAASVAYSEIESISKIVENWNSDWLEIYLRDNYELQRTPAIPILTLKSDEIAELRWQIQPYRPKVYQKTSHIGIVSVSMEIDAEPEITDKTLEGFRSYWNWLRGVNSIPTRFEVIRAFTRPTNYGSWKKQIQAQLDYGTDQSANKLKTRSVKWTKLIPAPKDGLLVIDLMNPEQSGVDWENWQTEPPAYCISFETGVNGDVENYHTGIYVKTIESYPIDGQEAFQDFFNVDWKSGTFQDSFHSLHKITKNYSGLPLDKIGEILRSEIERGQTQFTILNFSISVSQLDIWGMLILCAMQIYFLMYLSGLVESERIEKSNWLPLLPVNGGFIFTVVTVVGFPLSVCLWFAVSILLNFDLSFWLRMLAFSGLIVALFVNSLLSMRFLRLKRALNVILN